MLLSDYFRDTPDLTWDIALQCGVRHGTIRLPDDKEFDVTSAAQLRIIYEGFLSHGITPLLLEPLPNALHDHIKYGDQQRDERIEKFIHLMKNLHEVGITTVCFNFMAHYGWTRTSKNLLERGNAEVTGFSLQDFVPDTLRITHSQLWENYTYFIKFHQSGSAAFPDTNHPANFFGFNYSFFGLQIVSCLCIIFHVKIC